MNLSSPTSLNGSPKGIRHNPPQFQHAVHYRQRDQRLIDISDEDLSDDEVRQNLPLETGNLNKWTNMLHGWQERYFVLKDGVLSYFRSADDVTDGCRGAIRLKNAQVQPHPYDDCRIDVSLGDSTWYFRCPSAQSRRHWVDCIERHRLAESGYSSEQALTTQSSLLSLNSIASTSNLGGSSNALRKQNLLDKISEIESFKTVLTHQADKLQAYLDTCHRIAALAEEQGGYDLLLDPSMFEETLSQLRLELSALQTAHKAAQSNSDDDGFKDSCDDRDSLVSESCSDDLILSTPCADLPPTLGVPNSAYFSAPQSLLAVNDSPEDSNPNQGAISKPAPPEPVIPDSGDEGAKTPKAGLSFRGGVGFFSRFLQFRSGNSNSNNADGGIQSGGSGDKTLKGPSSRSKQKVVSESTAHASRMHDVGVLLNHFGALSIEFGTEVDLFRSTCSALQLALNQTVDIMTQREDAWRRRLERESERRRVLERQLRTTQDALAKVANLSGRRGNTGGGAAIGRMGPGKAHQRSHSHGGQQSLYGGSQLFPGLTAALPPQRPPPAIPLPLTTNGVQGSPDLSAAVAGTGKMFIVDEGGPDFAEGGSEYCVSEEHFYDAIDAQIDKMHQDEACLEALKTVGETLRTAAAMPAGHALHAEVSRVCNERLGILRDGFPSASSTASGGWTVLAQQGDMTIYNREVESADGTYLDPLQAVHVVHGVTAREMCEAFWDVQYRLDWEITVDQAPTVIEVCGDDTVVQYQVYKRVWPATQRDSLFWSHLRPLDSAQFPTDDAVIEAGLVILDTWMVVNFSTKYGEDRLPAAAKTPSFIRLDVDVELFCQTLWKPPQPDFDKSALPSAEELRGLSVEERLARWEAVGVKRGDVRCRLLYASQINPGGWAPAAVVRTMARREYPHFLNRISTFVLNHTEAKPLKF